MFRALIVWMAVGGAFSAISQTGLVQADNGSIGSSEASSSDESNRAHEANGSDAETFETDLLIVGGSESAVAAAVQAARLGVERIALVNDIGWLGGQFTAEGLGAVDEWTIYHGRREPFPRSGLFLEIMNRIERRMKEMYGVARPGNSFCAWTTCEPRDAERLFRELLAPYIVENGGPVRLWEHYEPVEVETDGARVTAVRFTPSPIASPVNRAKSAIRAPLLVRAWQTIDASDWGDVIRLSGAGYFCGPDLRDRFDEPSAPTDAAQVQPNEMNPITYCLVLRESDRAATIVPPERYDVRTYFGATIATRDEYERVGWPKGTMRPFAPAFVDSQMKNGPYGETPSVYTHRRLVDRRHLGLAIGCEKVLVNWPLQDYPTYNFPQHVVDELEADEAGASKRNLVEMTPRQRRIVFADAKRHALGLLHYLQTIADERRAADDVSFRAMELTDEFETPDRLPWKPYVREGLRLDALYVLRETDVRDTDGVQSWSNHMPHDNVFGFQFNIDFHPTRRIFLDDDSTGPWAHIHSSYRNWGTHTDRAGFPLRSLIPVRFDGLIGAGKNLGYSSIVSSAVRLHGHGMMAGQAAGALAAMSIRDDVEPRRIAASTADVRRLQTAIVEPDIDRFTDARPPGVLLWPYHDVPANAPHFAAVNQLAVRAILVGDPGEQDFFPERPVSRREAARWSVRAALSTGRIDAYRFPADSAKRRFGDVDVWDNDFATIETLAARMDVAAGTRTREESGRREAAKPAPSSDTRAFHPDAPSTREFFAAALHSFGWRKDADEFLSQDAGQVRDKAEPSRLTRGEAAILVWNAVAAEKEFEWGERGVGKHEDVDGDEFADIDDPLPFDRDNDGTPDRLDVDNDNDGLPDGVVVPPSRGRQFNFAGPGVPDPPGYVTDRGAVFDESRGFGWRRDISANHRRRHRSSDLRLDTFLFTRETDTWECSLPNGRYRVTIVIGDSGFEQPGQKVVVEGKLLFEDRATAIGEHGQAATTLDVHDGRLTIEIGSGRPMTNTCLNWLRIESLDNDGE